MMLVVATLCAFFAGDLDADPRFMDAVARFRKLEYEAALTQFEALVAESQDDRERARLLLWSGAARTLLGDDGAARLAFENALRLDPDVTLSFKTSPKVVELFAAVKERVDATRPPPSPPPPDPEPDPPPTTTNPTTPTRADPAAPPPPPTTPASSGGGAMWILAATTGALGAASAVGAGYFGYDALAKIQFAEDADTSQQAAVDVEDDINASLWIAGALGGATLALAATSIVGVVLATSDDGAE